MFPLFLKKKSFPRSLIFLIFSQDQKALLILDLWQGLRAAAKSDFDQCITAMGFEIVWIPASCTDEMQPLDIAVNGTLKAHLKECFTTWAQGEVARQLALGVPLSDFKLPLDLSVLKPLHLGWLQTAYAKVTNDMAHKGFERAGIVVPTL